MSGLVVDVEKRLGATRIAARFDGGRGVTALYGRSGAGKSSIVAMIAGLLRPDGGSVRLGARVLSDASAGIFLPPRARRVGCVFQDPLLFPHLSVRGNLRFARLFGRGTRDAGRFDGIVDLLGLEGLLDRRPGALSGGEKRRVAIGRALLSEPELLLMDEPLSGLDAGRKADILPWLERLRDAGGVPIVYVSHVMDEVARLADTLVLVSDGVVAAAGPLEDIVGRLDLRPLTGRYEAGAVFRAVAEPGAPEGLTRWGLGAGRWVEAPGEAPEGAEARLRIRARDVALAVEPPQGISIRNVLPGRIAEMRREDGPFVEVAVTVADGIPPVTARITQASADALGLDRGRSVWALVKAVALDGRGTGRRRA